MLKKENMKKHLFRVKQLADQTVGRAEKSEVLSEDLINAEKRIKLIEHVCSIITKKLQGCLQGSGPDVEKRLKKIPHMALATSLHECSSFMGDSSLLGALLNMCSEAQSSLASELLQLEYETERMIIAPLAAVLENDIPGITKLRKQLAKHTLDMDSARSRYQSAVRQSSVSGGVLSTTKIDLIKEDLDEAQAKVEQSKDALATEIFAFLAKESEFSQLFIQLIEVQTEFHRNALQTLERIIPNMKAQLVESPMKPVYGIPLEEHLKATERDIALVLETCILTLLETGMKEEGLFRITGSASKVKKLKTSLDAGLVDMTEFITDPASVAGALKSYFRELPEPLMTYSLYEEWMQLSILPEERSKLQAIWMVLDKMPKPNFNNLRYLIKFLSKLAEHSDVNKMSPSNIAIVIAPNLLWSTNDDGMNMVTTGLQSSIIELLITNAEWFFPGELDFSNTSSENIKSPITPTTPNAENNVEGLDAANRPPSPDPSISSQESFGNPASSPTSPKLLKRNKKPAPPVPAERHLNEKSSALQVIESPSENALIETSTVTPPERRNRSHDQFSEKVTIERLNSHIERPPTKPPAPPDRPVPQERFPSLDKPASDRPYRPPPPDTHPPPPPISVDSSPIILHDRLSFPPDRPPNPPPDKPQPSERTNVPHVAPERPSIPPLERPQTILASEKSIGTQSFTDKSGPPSPVVKTRPVRPTPPPPPPPIRGKSSNPGAGEETHL